MTVAETDRPGKRWRTRMFIIETAVDLLQDHDWKDLTVERVAEEARLVKSTVFNHFKGKADLLNAVCLHVCDQIERDVRLERVGQPMGARSLGPQLRVLHDALGYYPWLAAKLWEALTCKDQDCELAPVLSRFAEIVEDVLLGGYRPPRARTRRDAMRWMPHAEMAASVIDSLLLDSVFGRSADAALTFVVSYAADAEYGGRWAAPQPQLEAPQE